MAAPSRAVGEGGCYKTACDETEKADAEASAQSKHVTSGRFGTYFSSGDVDEDFKQAKKKKKMGNSKHVARLFRLVWPRELGGSEVMGCGAGSIVTIGGLALVRCWLLSRIAEAAGTLTRAIHKKDWRLFRVTILSHALLGFGHTLFRRTMNLCVTQLSLAWRECLTERIHAAYFTSMNYYRLLHSKVIQDPDSRIGNDVRATCDSLADLVEQGFLAITSGVFFFSTLYRELGLRYAMAPYGFIVFSMWWTDKVWPLDWRTLVGTMEHRFSLYKNSHARVLLNSEAIAALKGHKAERKIILKQLADTEQVQLRFWDALVPYQFLMEFSFREGVKAFTLFVIFAPLVLDGQPPAISSTARAALLATAEYRRSIFLQSVASAGALGTAYRALRRIGGNAVRVTSLLDTLTRFSGTRDSHAQERFVEGSCIAFQGVDISTPEGTPLVKDLNFVVNPGESLMITGHNGAGKSSIFRCLGGLWQIDNGVIVKPGASSSGLHADIFYIPQKPYNVLGTLSDQITYPEVGRQPLSLEQLRALLSEVELLYLLDRNDVKNGCEVNWEDELSLGEKQRLAMARLIYHKPTFAILDECTSAVSNRMETQIFVICQKLNISYITISHRPTLSAYHQRVLSIGKKNQGWELVTNADFQPQTALCDHRGPNGTKPQEQNPVVSERSAPYTDLQRVTKSTSNLSSVAKLIALLRIGWPSGLSLKLVCAMLAVIFRTYTGTMWIGLSSDLLSAALLKDFSALPWLGGRAIVWAALSAAAERACQHSQRVMGTMFRVQLSKKLLGLYFETSSFYRLKMHDRTIMDPEQRLTTDIRKFAINLSELVTDVAAPISDIVWYSVLLWRALGTRGIAPLWVYAIFGIGLVKAIMPNYSKIVKEEKTLESKFMLEHSRVRQASESIAFFGGDEREHEIIRARFRALTKLREDTAWKSWKFELINRFFIDKLPSTLTFAIRMLFVSSVVGSTTGTVLASNLELIARSSTTLFDSFGKLLGYGPSIAALSGYVSRLHEMLDEMESLRNLRKDAVTSNTRKFRPAPTRDSQSSVELHNVDIVTPNGLCLAKCVNAKVPHRQGIMVTGPNASGKTSVLRVISGLWPAWSRSIESGGFVKRPDSGPSEIGSICLVPQRVYCVPGSLADQLTYPYIIPANCRTKADEAHLMKQLDLVRISYLIERHNGWDTEKDWTNILSLGEQQRLAMARLFHHKPYFALLDECTSAVSVDVEESLYAAASAAGITCITCSQRLALTKFHSAELRLGLPTDAGWDLVSLNTI